jgi:hypothetical protein
MGLACNAKVLKLNFLEFKACYQQSLQLSDALNSRKLNFRRQVYDQNRKISLRFGIMDIMDIECNTDIVI